MAENLWKMTDASGESINQYFMSVHIVVMLDKKKRKKFQFNFYLYYFSHRTMNNRFDNVSENISIIQNISYIVVNI